MATSGKIAKCFNVEGLKSIEDVLDASSTNWDVEVLDANGAGFASGGRNALIRPDTRTALNFVTKRFKPNKHREQLGALDGMVRAGNILPVNVSVWDDGAIQAYQFRCPDLDVNINGKDMVSPLLTLAFSYGVTLADSAFFADFRWFCKNQLGKVAEVNKDSRVTHRGDTVNRFAEILGSRIQELSSELGDHYSAMRRMVNTELRGKALQAYFGEAIGVKKEELDMYLSNPTGKYKGDVTRLPEILTCYQVDDCGAEGSVWQAYNAVTRYQTHMAGRTEETRMRRMLLGSGGQVANRAFEVAAAIAA